MPQLFFQFFAVVFRPQHNLGAAFAVKGGRRGLHIGGQFAAVTAPRSYFLAHPFATLVGKAFNQLAVVVLALAAEGVQYWDTHQFVDVVVTQKL